MSPALLLQIAVWLATAVCLALAAWAVFWYRPRGGARCLCCGYSRNGLRDRAAAVCPECGNDARRAGRLYRLRRRWCIAIPACLLAGVLPIWLLPAIERRNEGRMALVPTTALILSLRGRAEKNWLEDLTWRRLMRRDDKRPLPAWQIRLLAAWVAPINEAYAESLVTRPRAWYRGEPIPIRLKQPSRLGIAGYNATVSLVDEHETLIWTSSAGPNWPEGYRGSYFVPLRLSGRLAPVTEGHAATPDLVLQVRARWDWARSLPRNDVNREHDVRLRLSIPLVDRGSPGAIAAISTPRSGEAYDQILLDRVRLSFAGGANFSVSSPRSPILFVFDLEVLDADLVIWRRTILPNLTFGQPRYASVHGVNIDANRALLRRLVHVPNDDDAALEIHPGNLMIRIRSRPDLAIYDLEHDTHWEGEITRPFRELFKNQHPSYRVVGED